MKTFVATDGQSLLDVCLNVYASLDYLVKLMLDNGVDNVNADVISGQVFEYDDTVSADQSISMQNQQQQIIYATKQKVDYRIGNRGDFNDDFSSDFNI